MLLKLGIFCMLFHCVIAKSGLLVRDSALFVERNSVVFSESSCTLMTGIDLSPGIDLVTLDNWLLKRIYDNATGILGSFRELTIKKTSVEARWEAGGIALKWIFGVSTQEDLEAAHR